MRKFARPGLIGLCLTALLGLACNTTGFPFNLLASPTPTPTATPPPTPTPTATRAPTPSPLPSPTQVIQFGEELRMDGVGASFRLIEGYGYGGEYTFFFMSSPDDSIVIFVTGMYETTEDYDLDRYLQTTIQDMQDERNNIIPEPPYPIQIDDRDGLAVDFTGTRNNREIAGQIVVVMPYEHQFVLTYGMAFGPGRWEEEGKMVFTAFLETVSFYPLP